MRLFVLAAGTGSRLSPETHDRPKCLIPLHDGTTFLSRLMRAAADSRYVEKATIITGHHRQRVEQEITRMRPPLDTDTVYNPFYDTAGPIVSLWAARDRMRHDDFLICNGDTFYANRPLELLWTPRPESVRLCVDSVSHPQADDMKVHLDPGSRLLRVGKKVPAHATNAVSAGLLLVKGPRMRQAFDDAVMQIIHDRTNLHRGHTWHDVLNVLSGAGVAIETVAVAPTDWAEVDTPEDLGRIRSQVNGKTPPEDRHKATPTIRRGVPFSTARSSLYHNQSVTGSRQSP